VVILPRSVLRQDETVLVVNAANQLEIRTVEVARAEPRNVYITSGVGDGEWVVTTTIDAPIPGTKLAIRGHEPPGGGGAGEGIAADAGGYQ
jgi:hypothetical protein